MKKKAVKQKKFNRCGEIVLTWQQLYKWYQTPLGLLLAKSEQAILDKTLANLFGYQIVQLGRISDQDCLKNSRVLNSLIVEFIKHDEIQELKRIQGVPYQLPFQSDSIDILVLPHTLEFTQYPHDVLREAERVLIADGHLVILAFNPWSPWTIWRSLLSWRGRSPWCGHTLSSTRLKDWLALLGFEVMKVTGYFFRPPLQSRRVMKRLRFLDSIGKRIWPFWGASNAIVAQKQTIRMTPIRPRWRRNSASVVTPGLAERGISKRTTLKRKFKIKGKYG